MADIVVEDGTGLATANSYCSEDEASDYHENHLYKTDWTGANGTQRENALIMASRLLDEMVKWDGSIVYTTSGLRWPRHNIWHEDGYMISSTSIPSFLKNATAEFARKLLVEDRTDETNRDLRGFKKIAIGDLKIEVDAWTAKPVMPPSVWSIIRDYAIRIGGRDSRTLVRM
jgi:hypothetical protein